MLIYVLFSSLFTNVHTGRYADIQSKAKSNHMLQGKHITVSLFNIATCTQTRPCDLSGSGCVGQIQAKNEG